MSDFEAPRSPNAAALQNILGANNVLRAPQSENEALLQLIAQQTQTLINTLNEVKNTVDILSSIQRYIGVTTTELSDGATTNPIVIDGESVTAVSGDAVIYDGEDFVFNGSIWQSVPDALGALAYKNSASGNFTPQGTVSQPTFTGSQATITMTGTPSGSVAKPTVAFIPTSKGYIMTTKAGTLPSLTYNSETNTVTFSAGTLPTTENKNILIGGGCQVNGNLTFTGNEMTLTTTVTPQGMVSQPTFTGTQVTVMVE